MNNNCPGAECPQVQHPPGHGQQGAQTEGPCRHQHQHAGGELVLHRGQAQQRNGPGEGGAPYWLAGSQSGEADQPGGGPGPEGRPGGGGQHGDRA